MKSHPLSCPNCAAPLTSTEVLEACSASDPESGLLRLYCPRCGATAFVRLDNGRLEVGTAPAEGPAAFRPSAAVAEPELFVRRDAGWVDCWFGKVYRRFPVAV